jgi:hypothetical protein
MTVVRRQIFQRAQKEAPTVQNNLLTIRLLKLNNTGFHIRVREEKKPASEIQQRDDGADTESDEESQ